jgi:hypothetical protein
MVMQPNERSRQTKDTHSLKGINHMEYENGEPMADGMDAPVAEPVAEAMVEPSVNLPKGIQESVRALKLAEQKVKIDHKAYVWACKESEKALVRLSALQSHLELTMYIKPPEKLVFEDGLPEFPGWYPTETDTEYEVVRSGGYLRYWNGSFWGWAGFHDGKFLDICLLPSPYSNSEIRWAKPWWLHPDTKDYRIYYRCMQEGVPEKIARLVARYADEWCDCAQDTIVCGFTLSTKEQGQKWWDQVHEASMGNSDFPAVKDEWLKV